METFRAHLREVDIDLLEQRITHEELLAECSIEEPKKFHKYIRERKQARPSVGPLKIGGAVTGYY